MSTIDSLNPLRSLKLISHEQYLNNFITFYEKRSFPNVLMLSGKKGIGKYTLVNHFLNYIFNKNTKTPYDLVNKSINENSPFYKSILNNTSQDILYLNINNKKVKIDDIRNLRNILSKKTFNSNPRFIIIDEVEFLNANSSNALLKILEEPTKNNFFILINNNQSQLLETISSRCIKNNIFLSPSSSKKIINYLVESKKVEVIINPDTTNLTPGLYFEFNHILTKNNIILKNDISETISSLLNLYKKSKNNSIINLCTFLIEEYIYNQINLNKNNINSFIILKEKIFKILRNLEDYNLNVTSIVNSIKLKINHVQ